MKKVDGYLTAFTQKNIRKWLVWAIFVLLVAVRMSIPFCQRVFLIPEGSGLDDMLMIRAAMSFTEGQWFGAYGGAAIAKNMGFALWLALLHTLKIPVLVANTAVWAAACAFAVWALRPVCRGNLSRLCVFGFLAFQPVSFAAFTMRVYRDGLFPAASLLFFAGIVGLALRINQTKLRGSLACAFVGGLGFAAAWLLREDGIVLLAYAVCGLGLFILFALLNGKLRKNLRRLAGRLVCAVLPFVVLGAGILGFSAANAANYGVFMVSDMTSGAFPSAYGALVGVSLAESGYKHLTPVTADTLEKLYAEVPSMALLEGQLRPGGVVFNGFGNKKTGEYGGSFYYAVRLAAGYEGITPTAQSAQVFWADMEREITLAVQEGRLRSAKASASTVPRWDSSLLAPAAAETGASILHTLTFLECDPRPAESIGEPEDIEWVSAYLYSPVQKGYVEGTATPYYNPLQKLVFGMCDMLVWLYRILIWPLLALALVQFCRILGGGVSAAFKEKKAAQSLLYALLLLGLLLSFVVRMVVSAYMEVAAFDIGTYIMYLAGGMPPLLLFIAGALFWPPKQHEMKPLPKK